MPFWRLFYHMVWATKNRDPLILPSFEADMWKVIVGKGAELGALVHAVGGTEDHVHVVASVPPRISLSEFIQQLKGSSSHFANHRPESTQTFGWQAEYGVVSFDGKRLDQIVRYAKNQREHHQTGTTIAVLEGLTAERPRDVT